MIGKGNELRQHPTSGVASGEQWDQLAERYELLRRLWREENVIWEGKFRGPLDSVTSLPRLYAGEPPSWHGSATILTSAALAANWGDPLFGANAIQPRANYKVLIEHYRAEYVRTDTILGTPTSVPALVPSSSPTPPRRPGRATGRSTSRWRRSSTGQVTTPGNEMTFTDIDDPIARGPVLAAARSPQPAARSPQPAARSPQPAARSPQPAARSPQPAAD